ncbi:Uncharacterised protein [Serratia ficaria]|uniref:hypothetical protein n=1 Tax=Serratia ficaria TaxID=61651 RepID=UPI002182D19E|nr:hypothetical protein [Serratia ficaria]CAI2469417.1 Uncharacterised protein [Serratia ficaria]
MREINLPLGHTGIVEDEEEGMIVYDEDGEVALTVGNDVPDAIVADILWVQKRAFDRGVEVGEARMKSHFRKMIGLDSVS